MKIHNLIAENIKKIKFVDITPDPDGAVITISGANDSGKSSVLDSIYWALAGSGAIESMPVRKGEQSARIRLDLGEIVVTRKWADGKTSLVVESAEGDKFTSPQTLLDKLMGTLTFDPLAFADMEPAKQLATLRSIVTLDENVDALQLEYNQLYEGRTVTSRQAKALEARVGPRPPAMDRVEVSVTELHAELERRRKHNQNAGHLEAERAARSGFIAGKKSTIKDIESRIADLTQALHLERGMLAQAEDEFTRIKPPLELMNEDEVLARIQTAERDNREISAMKHVLEVWDQNAADLAKLREGVDATSVLMANLQERRRAAFARAKMPLEGLEFAEGQVLFNGVPLDQASTAQQIKVSIRIAMALNPKLKILRVKNGSLLDENNLELVRQMVELEGYQLWLERVDTSGGVGVVMEDGEVARPPNMDPFVEATPGMNNFMEKDNGQG